MLSQNNRATPVCRGVPTTSCCSRRWCSRGCESPGVWPSRAWTGRHATRNRHGYQAAAALGGPILSARLRQADGRTRREASTRLRGLQRRGRHYRISRQRHKAHERLVVTSDNDLAASKGLANQASQMCFGMSHLVVGHDLKSRSSRPTCKAGPDSRGLSTLAAYSNSQPRGADLPDRLDIVSLEQRVIRRDDEMFETALRNEHAIKRIPMFERQARGFDGVRRKDRERQHSTLDQN